MGIFIFKNYKFLYMYGDFAHCTSRFSLSKYKDIFNSGKQKAVHVLPFFLSLHLWCWGLKQGPHCSSTAELHPQPFSLGLHVSVYCFPNHVFLSVLYREGRRHYPKSLFCCKAPFPTLLTANWKSWLSVWAPLFHNFSCNGLLHPTFQSWDIVTQIKPESN